MMKGFFDTLPARARGGSGEVDGATRTAALWLIVLPLARPRAWPPAASIWRSSRGANSCFARTLVSRPENWLVTVGLQSFIGEYLVDWPALMGRRMVSLLPMFVLCSCCSNRSWSAGSHRVR
jgi:ABC-type glycerol-3-phosphate transport system permease component